jgi:hypothetical protein
MFEKNGPLSASKNSDLGRDRLFSAPVKFEDTIKPTDYVKDTCLEEFALSKNIPQWLIYCWTLKSGSLYDRKTQQFLCDLLMSRKFHLTLLLCSATSNHQIDSVARSLLCIFGRYWKVFKNIASLANSDNALESRGFYSGSSLFQPIDICELGISDSRPNLEDFKKNDQTISFLQAAVEEEINVTCMSYFFVILASEANLLRENNIISKLLSLYANNVGKDYLDEILQPAFKKVREMGNLEVDPAKIPQKDTSTAASNMEKLLQATKIILDCVTSSISKCPIGLKKLCYVIQREVQKKFVSPKSKQIAVSRFIFLRFICPAIASPDIPDLTGSQRRSLVLISKIIQCIANGVHFKEQYMIPANSFLQENEAQLFHYCEALQDIEPEIVYTIQDSENQPVMPSKNEDFNYSFIVIMNQLNQCLEKLVAKDLEHQLAEEELSFTVFNALHSIIARFNTLERIHALNTSSSPNIKNSNTKQAFSIILLGGLEEVFLMNECVILKGLIYPPNYSVTKSSTALTLVTSNGRELELLSRSIVNVVGSVSSAKLRHLIQWAIQQEINLRRENYSKHDANMDYEIFKHILDESSSHKSSGNTELGSSLTQKLILAFFITHAKDYLCPIIGELLEDFKSSTKQYEIDPNHLGPDDILKNNLDNLSNAAKQIINVIISNPDAVPEAMKLFLRFMYETLGKDY